MDTTTSSSETRCKNPSCERQLPQRASGGHRQREYCDDSCRQAARRTRLGGESRARSIEAVRSWGDFQPATIDLLAGLLAVGSGEYARRLASIIGEEQGGLAQLQERFRSYVETTNERVGNFCGELAALRRERERETETTGKERAARIGAGPRRSAAHVPGTRPRARGVSSALGTDA